MNTDKHTGQAASSEMVKVTVQHDGRGYDLWRSNAEDDQRALDLDLARWAGMKNPSKIVEMIGRYESDLNDLGFLLRKEKIIIGRGRPRTETYLNQAQAIWLLAKMDTDTAKAALKVVIAVYLQVMRGQIPDQRPAGFAPSDDFEAQIRDALSRLLAQGNDAFLQGSADRASRAKAGQQITRFLETILTAVGQADEGGRQRAAEVLAFLRWLADEREHQQQHLLTALNLMDSEIHQLRAGQEAMAAQVRALLEGRPQQRAKRPRPQILEVDPRSYLLRAKTVPGALAHVQALALDALKAAREHTEIGEALVHLQSAERALRAGRVAAATKSLGRALELAKGSQEDGLTAPAGLIREAQRLIVARARYTYSEHHRPGRRKFLPLGLGEDFSPASYPVWIELLNAGGEIVAGPLFVEPAHAEAQETVTPIHSEEHLRRYNTWMKAKNRMRRGIAPLVKAASRRPKEAN